ncbi:MAG: hypothetical protein HRU38_09405 [Saccharospirillaceae bacterium]|nr:hypothetical protein [Pseudomonadales bacterium]NRB78870.1 hypothetical protein [Saccharospirillaceae bacterium]
MFKIKTSLIIALVVFLITLVLTVPNSYLLSKFSAQVSTLPFSITNTQGHISNGSGEINYQGITGKISWKLNSRSMFIGKLKGHVKIEILDSTVTADIKIGLNTMELYNLNGQLSYLTINELGKSQRLKVDGDVSIQNFAIKISQSSSKNDEGVKVVVKTLENLEGRIIYTGGDVIHPAMGNLNVPRIIVKTEILEDKWKVKINDENDNLLSDIDFYSDGLIYVQGYKTLSPIINKQFGGTDPIIIQNHVFPTF